MDKLQNFKESLGGSITAMRAMLDTAEKENRNLTENETVKYEAMKAEVLNLQASIKREEELLNLEANLSKPEPRIIQPAQPTASLKDAYTFKRTGKLKAFKGPQAEEKAYRSGMWVKAALFGEEHAKQWCRDQGIQIKAAQQGGVNTAGGFLVPEEFEQTIIDLRESYGVARQECNVMPMARDTLVIPRRTGGVTAYFTDESGSITESAAAWDQVSLTARKLATLTRMSTEIAEDAVISLGDWLANEIAYSFALKEDQCLFDGDGTSTYGGIVGLRPKIIDGNHAAGAVDVATATHNLFSEIDATDLATLMAALPRYALMNAKWYMSQTAYSLVIERLVQAAGGNTINDMSAGAQLRYMGYPVVISQAMPAGAATDYNNVAMLFFGDMSKAATLGDRRGTTVATSTDRYFDSDEIAIRGTERFDINVHDLGDGTTAGPIVGLIGSSS